MEQQLLEECFPPCIAFRLHLDAQLVLESKTFATVKFICTRKVIAAHQSVKKIEKRSKKCFAPSLHGLCENLQPLLAFMTRLFLNYCASSRKCSRIAARSVDNLEMSTSKNGLLLLIFASREWRNIMSDFMFYYDICACLFP